MPHEEQLKVFKQVIYEEITPSEMQNIVVGYCGKAAVGSFRCKFDRFYF